MKKVIAYYMVMFLVISVLGCGDSTDKIVTPGEEIKSGLSGNSYLNTVYGISISNLPTQPWTIKALGNDMKGLKLQSEQGYIPFYYLLLMEPVKDNEFVGPDKYGYLEPVFNAGIPFIVLAVDNQKGTYIETYSVSREIELYAEINSLSIESKKTISIGNYTGIQAILSNNESSMKSAITWFAKGDIMVRYEYWAKDADFDSYLTTYDNILKSFSLMGK